MKYEHGRVYYYVGPCESEFMNEPLIPCYMWLCEITRPNTEPYIQLLGDEMENFPLFIFI